MKIIQIAWGRILPSDRISTATPGPLRYVFFAATMLGLHGCVSSPADQLAQIQTTAATRPANLVELAAQQKAAASEEQSEIATQAQEDVQSLDPTDLTATHDASESQGLLTQPRNIAATQNSIYSTSDSNFNQQGLVAKTGRLKADPGAETVAATKSSIYANNSVEAVIAADAQNEQAAADTLPSYDSLAERMAVPMPDASDVKQVQDVAMADTEIPVLDPNAASNALDTTAGPDSELASADPAITNLQELQTSLTKPANEQVEKSEKKPLTLADLFRKKDSKDFDGDRFAKKTVTRGIPNMQTAALSDNALPGVNANAMFPTNRMSDDEEHEGDDEPAGLMQLASLPSMTRIAPNGLYIQTDKVEVRCLRPQLVDLIHQVENHYKRPAIITSGFRDPRHNRRAGGVRHSLHTLCAAADIQVQGVSKWELADYLRSLPGRGGIGTYCHTESVHIDIGSERDWNWRCRRKKRARS
jgi:uncharacterized protein YcbK (DUF882 family)